ncbi:MULTISPECIES: hypothetical protein [Caballeronia]|uniref:Uncharacterized protein n=2 Tax=Caballeronia TaxID=1827195 RepID=A0ACB5QR64_9BURK|nr:hypothetical protein [Caballeronia sp. GaOx3]GJH17207.1 hypothetical protein CBA19CS22_11715 [Caballeronia novacaledonica]
MDIFYYWQKLESNLKNRELGYFGSNNSKLTEVAERLPKRIWVFKTPRGMKGSIQLMGSLLVCEEPRVAIKTDYPNVVYYDLFSPESVIYTDSNTPERIAEVSGYFQYRFHTAFSANFQGDSGLQALESNVVRGLESIVAGWDKVQMLEKVEEREKVQPINPFNQQTR